MSEDIMQSDIWEKLSKNPKFEWELEKCLKNYSYNSNITDLVFETTDDKLVIICNTRIVNRDLDCQYKLYEKSEIYLDEDNNLIVNSQSGRLESKYGYNFDNTNGGVINTQYSCEVFDADGVELSYQGYSDKYHLDNNEFNAFKKDFPTFVVGAYNPQLSSYANVTGVYPHASVIGRNARYIRKIRSNNNLGIIEVTRCSYSNDARVLDAREEYYFNTFFTSTSKKNPEVIHIMNGFPFAIITPGKQMMFDNDYIKSGLTGENYKEVARTRFLKELQEEKGNIIDDQITLDKYDLMIGRLENEIANKKRIH